jgi:acyl dehydratase
MGLIHPEVKGRTYDDVTFAVTAEGIRAYTSAYNDDNPAYREGDLAPPMLAVVYAFEASLRPLLDPELSPDPGKMMRRLVRGELDVKIFGEVHAGDTLTTRARVEDVVEKGSGELLTLVTESYNQRGEHVATVGNVHFIRGDKKPGGASADDVSKKQFRNNPTVAMSQVFFSQAMQVKPEQPFVYADASLDRNPIHTDEAVAQAAGFPTVILQGSCTLAFAQKAIIDEVLGREPRRLARVKARFTKPVFPKEVLTTRGWKSGPQAIGFETVNQDGVTVLSDGVAEYR